jgi:hypothetical protein
MKLALISDDGTTLGTVEDIEAYDATNFLDRGDLASDVIALIAQHADQGKQIAAPTETPGAHRWNVRIIIGGSAGVERELLVNADSWYTDSDTISFGINAILTVSP